MLGRVAVEIRTPRLILRPPVMNDHMDWARARKNSRAFIEPWEPIWATDHLSRSAFRNRVSWAKRTIRDGRALPLMILRNDGRVIGALTLDNIRRGPAQMGTVGYWIAEDQSGQGLMTEALSALVQHAFTRMDLSRIEAACLPENTASRALLERCGFKYEGVAQSYLQIAGRWRNHVLYAQLRNDRRGRSGAV